MDAGILAKLVEDRAAKRPVVLATRLTDGFGKLLYPTEKQQESWLTEVSHEVLASDRASVIAGPDGDWFLNPFNPPLRLLVVGAVHIAPLLARMAALTTRTSR